MAVIWNVDKPSSPDDILKQQLIPPYIGTHDAVYLDGVRLVLGGEPPTAK
jgi:hypothetical protein